MPIRYVFSIAIITTFLLGCDNHQRVEAGMKHVTSVSINALPIIMSAVTNEISEINGDNRDAVLSSVCRVAYGEIQPAAFRDEITQAGLIQNNSAKPHSLSLLIQSDNVKPYQTACAAYIITSINTIPNINKYVNQLKDNKGQSIIEYNEKDIINLMPFRLAVARATAELYGKIAADLSDKDAHTMEVYNQKVNRLFAKSAMGYLNTVRKYNEEEMSNHYQLLLLQKGKFTFKSSTGYLMDVNSEGFFVYLYGTPWLANGYILGMTHGIDVEIK